MNTSIDRFSQADANASNCPPKNLAATPRKYCREVNVVSIRSQELIDDCAKLSRAELRNQYRREANSHRNGKSRCNGSDYIWHPDFNCFRDFLLNVGPCPGEGYTLDRIDSSDPEYAPGKVRWASKIAQTHNRKITRFLENSRGESLSVSEWGRRTGIPPKTITERVTRHSWSVDEATTTPVGMRRAKALIAAPLKCVSMRHPSSVPFVSIWRQLMADVHGQEFCSFTAAEKKMIKDVANRFDAEGLSSTEVLTSVITHWSRFTQYARDYCGAFGQIPAVPMLNFLTKYCNAAGNFFLAQKKEAIKDARRQAEQAEEDRERTEREQARSKLQAIKEALPEYRLMTSLLKKLRQNFYTPEILVTPKMRKFVEAIDSQSSIIRHEPDWVRTDRAVAKQIKIDLTEELKRLEEAFLKGEHYTPWPLLEILL